VKFRKLDAAEPAVEIVNVVASATLDQAVNLDAIVQVLPNAEYPSPKFPGVVFRLERPETSTLIFSSGKMVCTGGRSVKEAVMAISRVVRELKRKGLIVSGEPQISIENIVASASLGRKVDLEGSTLGLQNAMYEPEQFPGVVYRMEDPEVVFLIFSSGRVVCVGARAEEDVHRAIDKLDQEIRALETPGLSQNGVQKEVEVEDLESISESYVSLTELASPVDGGGKCSYIYGLWCHNESCDGLPCRFARLIKGMLDDGVYGCWGFHWQEKWYTMDIKRLHRKFINHVSSN
jgi:transcription initiation factor TFIID TATA-box-binding protein